MKTWLSEEGTDSELSSIMALALAKWTGIGLLHQDSGGHQGREELGPRPFGVNRPILGLGNHAEGIGESFLALVLGLDLVQAHAEHDGKRGDDGLQILIAEVLDDLLHQLHGRYHVVHFRPLFIETGSYRQNV